MLYRPVGSKLRLGKIHISDYVSGDKYGENTRADGPVFLKLKIVSQVQLFGNSNGVSSVI